jgi:HD-GYP domain-containing protein (c-di-GMP phosphodiesterase class II)
MRIIHGRSPHTVLQNRIAVFFRNGLMASVVASALFFTGCSRQPVASVDARLGLANLRDNVGFLRGNLVRLDGEWEYYPGKLLYPADFSDTTSRDVTGREVIGLDIGEPLMTRVPGTWAFANGFSEPTGPITGVGTLRLRVRIPTGMQNLALRVPNANTSLRLYVDGGLLAEIGAVSGNEDESVPSTGLAYSVFQPSGDEIEFIMQVANYSTPHIGTWDAPILGRADSVLSKWRFDVIVTALIAGALLIMGLYHLGLFAVRNKDYTTLLFGIICILMAARNLLVGERILVDLFPKTVAGWEWAFKIEHLSAHLTVPLFVLFFRFLFPDEIRRLPVIACVCVGSLWACLTLATPAMVYQRFLHWYEVFLFVAGLYVIGAIAVAAFKNRKGARIVMVGFLMLMGTVANDVLFSFGIISNTSFIASYGVFLYIFTQSFQLSIQFSEAFRDIELLSEGLKNKNRELETLHEIDLVIASSMDLENILAVIMEQAVKELGVDAADILLLDADSDTLSIASRIGFRTDALLHTRLRSGQGYAGQALLSDGEIIVNHLDKNAEGFARSPAFAEEGFAFYGGRRLTIKEKTVGVIELYRRTPFIPTESWMLFFRTIAGQAAIALDNADLLNGLRRANMELAEANDGTIESWAEALELRDRETEGHCRRVTEATVFLAERFGFTGTNLDRVRQGALLHDIGKMGIPDSILLKPGALTQEEFTVMQRHPVIAKNLLSRIKFLQTALDIPYCHHEKWDGTGYPQGLAREDIPLSARLFAVVDVWDALRSDRPYRSSWPEEKVLAHISSLSGTHFDPRAVDAFIEMRRTVV